jgi:SAM-dependent methyltransferase
MTMTYDRRYAAPAEEGAWRSYDVAQPDPGYFQFDWLSARHPDLYHAFALTSVALVDELTRRFDFSGLVVAEIAAGTGRCTLGLARHARRVIAIDVYPSVTAFAAREVRRAGFDNCLHVQADLSSIPLRESSVDAVVCCWGMLNHAEAYRVLKPSGLIVQMEGAGGPSQGELAPILAREFPSLVPQPVDEPKRAPLSHDRVLGVVRPDIRFVDDAIDVYAFDHVADYGNPDDAAAIFGRLFGPATAAHLRERQQSTVWSRLAIYSARVAK